MPSNDGTSSPSRYAAVDAEESSSASAEQLSVSDELVETVEAMTVAELEAAIEGGELSLSDVIAAERAGKARVTVLGWAPAEGSPNKNEES